MVVLELRGLRVPRLGGGDRGPRRHRRVQARACPRRPAHRPPRAARPRRGRRARTSSSTRREAEILRGHDPQRARVGGGRGRDRRRRGCAGRARCHPASAQQHQPCVVHRCARADRRRPASSSPRAHGSRGTSPNVGLKPTTPQNAAGMRIEPPPSPPSASGPSAGGDRGAGSAGRAAGRALEVPRVVRAAVDGRVRDPEVAELRRRRLGEDDRARGLEPLDRR